MDSQSKTSIAHKSILGTKNKIYKKDSRKTEELEKGKSI
jgi:hypothetical protein